MAGGFVGGNTPARQLERSINNEKKKQKGRKESEHEQKNERIKKTTTEATHARGEWKNTEIADAHKRGPTTPKSQARRGRARWERAATAKDRIVQSTAAVSFLSAVPLRFAASDEVTHTRDASTDAWEVRGSKALKSERRRRAALGLSVVFPGSQRSSPAPTRACRCPGRRECRRQWHWR